MLYFFRIISSHLIQIVLLASFDVIMGTGVIVLNIGFQFVMHIISRTNHDVYLVGYVNEATTGIDDGYLIQLERFCER